jgi:hypothetical protein
MVLLSAVWLAAGCQDAGYIDDDDTIHEDDDTGDDDDDTGDDDDASASCNPWDPIDVAGASWSYTSSYTFVYEAETYTDTGVEEVWTDGTTTFAGATVFRRSGAFTGVQAGVTVDWEGYDTCDSDFGNFDHGSLVSYTPQSASITTVNSTPVKYIIASPDTLIGLYWTTAYDQTVELHGNGQTEVQDFAADWTWNTVAMETITVPAGTFSAVHIHADYDSADYIGPHTGTLDTWWAEGVGLLRWDEQRPAEGGQYIFRELQSYGGL